MFNSNIFDNIKDEDVIEDDSDCKPQFDMPLQLFDYMKRHYTSTICVFLKSNLYDSNNGIAHAKKHLYELFDAYGIEHSSEMYIGTAVTFFPMYNTYEYIILDCGIYQKICMKDDTSELRYVFIYLNYPKMSPKAMINYILRLSNIICNRCRVFNGIFTIYNKAIDTAEIYEHDRFIVPENAHTFSLDSKGWTKSWNFFSGLIGYLFGSETKTEMMKLVESGKNPFAGKG